MAETNEEVKPKDLSEVVVNVKQALNSIPRGKPKSGRQWKTVRETRFSSMQRDKPFNTTWAKKMEQRKLLKAAKELEKEMKETKAKELAEKKRRREENKKRREENAKKGEVVQVIKNPAKIKRMRKKQLRQIEKR